MTTKYTGDYYQNQMDIQDHCKRCSRTCTGWDDQCDKEMKAYHEEHYVEENPKD